MSPTFGSASGPEPCPQPCPRACGHGMDVHSAELGCWRCDCTSGRPPVPGEDTRVLVAEGLAAWLQREALPPVVRDAEMMLRGEYPVTVAHGMPETPQEEAVVFYLLGHLAAETGCATSRSGGSEHTTFVFAGEGAKGAADQFLRAAREVGARWWKVTATSQPPWA